MPTRPETWRFQSIYNGFAHRGLTTVVDQAASTPINRAGRVVRMVGEIVDDATGRPVGAFTRLLATGVEGLRVRHEKIDLDASVRGRDFARALDAHAEAVYQRMEIAYVTLHAEHVGSILWPKLGYDFDLRRRTGDSDAERRAHAVLALMSPDARKVAGLPRPVDLLSEWGASPEAARRAAALALQALLPTAEAIERRELDGLLLSPLALVDFDADGSALGRTLMLGASWDGMKVITAP